MTVDQLNLVGHAHAGALIIAAKHPLAVFTSGRRDVAGQAHAMASNVIHNRHWIAQTYRPTPQSHQLQAWVDTHPGALSVEAITAGLAAIMTPWSDDARAHVSRHFSGQAFDVQPMLDAHGAPTAAGLAVIGTIHQLAGLNSFLTHEGGLARWHAQFTD